MPPTIPTRMIAGDPGAESVFRWTPRGQGRRPARRRTDGCVDLRPRRRRRVRRPHLHRPDRGQGRPARRRAGSPHPRHRAAPEPQSAIRRPGFRQQRGGLVGLSLRRVSRRTEAARSGDHLRDRHGGASRTRAALYSYRWQPQTDPFGVVHQTYDYPGVPVAPDSVQRRHGVLDGIRIPLRPHFGVIGVAPRESDLVDSIPPSYFGGNLDNWRLGKGAAVYLPVSVPGALAVGRRSARRARRRRVERQRRSNAP